LNTQFALQERVLLAIAAAARDRVRVEEIGWTNERRAMRLYVVSSPENIARLDAIRADLARLRRRVGLDDVLQVRVRVGVAVRVAHLDVAPESLAHALADDPPVLHRDHRRAGLGVDVDGAAAGGGVGRR
jgi:hypothetical protein